jgi:hypothetical protein
MLTILLFSQIIHIKHEEKMMNTNRIHSCFRRNVFISIIQILAHFLYGWNATYELEKYKNEPSHLEIKEPICIAVATQFGSINVLDACGDVCIQVQNVAAMFHICNIITGRESIAVDPSYK